MNKARAEVFSALLRHLLRLNDRMDKLEAENEELRGVLDALADTVKGLDEELTVSVKGE